MSARQSKGQLTRQSKQQIDGSIQQVVSTEQFTGPIPPPSILEGYESVQEGTAERIIKMAEEQAAHRQSVERLMAESEARDSLLGIILAFVLGIAALIAGVIIAFKIPEAAGAISGSILGLSGFGAIVVTFITSTRRK